MGNVTGCKKISLVIFGESLNHKRIITLVTSEELYFYRNKILYLRMPFTLPTFVTFYKHFVDITSVILEIYIMKLLVEVLKKQDCRRKNSFVKFCKILP